MLRIGFHTFGCKLNFTETAQMMRQVQQAGWSLTQDLYQADVVVVNTCTVTEEANKKCHKWLRQLTRRNPKVKVVLTGCYAQTKAASLLSLPNVIGVLGQKEKFQITHFLNEWERQKNFFTHCSEELDTFLLSYSREERTRVFFKLQDGCDYRCSFCTIPLVRGRSRSASPQEVLKQLQRLEEEGVKEVVFTGINLGDYRYGDWRLVDLLQFILERVQIPRFRLSSIEVNLFSDSLIAFIAQHHRIMPHFHIPLQSGSDNILKRMRRRYLTSFYKERIKEIRSAIPDVCIGVDVIVGFPTETQEDFEATYCFLEDLAPAYLHVFPYSERANTPAIQLKPIVPWQERKQRAQQLRKLSQQLRQNYYKRFQNQIRSALIEQTPKGGFLYGYTDNYLRVRLPYHPQLKGALIKVRLEQLHLSQPLFDVIPIL